MSNEIDKEELLEYLEIWKDAFKTAVKKSKLLSMMNKSIRQIELVRIEQAHKQIVALIKSGNE